MPYPGPIAYPSPATYPDFGNEEHLRVSVNGLVLGDTDEFGVRWTLPSFEGWSGSPGTTLKLTERERGHGSTASEPFLPSRFLKAEGFVHLPSHAAMEAADARLSGAVSLDPFELVVAHAATVKSCMAQRQGAVLFTELTDRLASYSLLLVAKDPRKYGDVITKTTALPSSTGGLELPAAFPWTFTGSSTSGTISIFNPGNEAAPVWLRINGPIPAGGWRITHLGQNRTVAFSTALALTSTEYMTVDMQKKQVMAQGQSSRSQYVSSRGWFQLDPGDNEISFSATNYSAAARLTVTTKPTWS